VPHDAAPGASILTSLNLKGGVGKTHLCWLLASVCEERKQRVLLIDTDPQGNLSNSFLPDRGSVRGVERLLDPAADCRPLDLLHRTAYPHIDLIPASPLVSRFDVSDQSNWEKAELHRAFLDPLRELAPLYDYIVFDCPPRLSLVSYAALVASHGVVVPLEAADWGAQGLGVVSQAVQYVQAKHNPKLKLLGYVISRFKARRAYQQTYLAQMRKHFGEKVFDTVIPDLAAFERSVTDAVPITWQDPRSKAACIARNFFDEVRSRLAGQRQGDGEVRPDHRVAANASV